MIDGNIDIPINRDENGDLVSGNLNVWTNTNGDGTEVSNDRGCENWGSDQMGSIGQVGDASATNSDWTLKPGGSGVGQLTCDNLQDSTASSKMKLVRISLFFRLSCICLY